MGELICLKSYRDRLEKEQQEKEIEHLRSILAGLIPILPLSEPYYPPIYSGLYDHTRYMTQHPYHWDYSYGEDMSLFCTVEDNTVINDFSELDLGYLLDDTWRDK